MWIDTDTASDDAVAMLMAFKNPNVEVVGVSVVAGNVPLEQATQSALYTAEICGAKVPIHAGANRALVRTFVTAQNVHGSDGMGDIGLPLHGRTPTSTNGVQVMIEAFRAAPGSMDLVTQSVHHATEHRAQIAGALAAKGITSVDLDAIDVWSLHDEIVAAAGE